MAKAKPDLKIEYRLIDKVIPNKTNVRTHDAEQVAKIRASIENFGWTKPIIVDEKGVVLAGHGALQAARQLELPRVPVIVRAGLTRSQKRAYMLADNKLGDESGWDMKGLRLELGDLKKIGISLESTGFELAEVDTILNPTPAIGKKRGQSKIVHECPSCGHKWQA